ncbi:MAG: type II toxin-antitoxin system RelE/ParE family toxin [Defluviitaleaceae bacterium]|nr:type II toxin-antitoxin system RelE/ParE family toxin [Defluviitaleaceae bacterium]
MDTKFKVEITPAFESDLRRFEHNLEAYPRKIARITAKIHKSLLLLHAMPLIYPVYLDVPKYRKIVIEDYLVLYTVDKRKNLVEVRRLLYSRMNIPDLIV